MIPAGGERSGRMAWLTWLALVGAIVLVAGCGGGGGGAGGGASRVPTPVQFTVDWAARSRGVTGPSSALSARLVLTGARPDGTDLSYPINREVPPDAYSRNYTTPETVIPGSWPLVMTFYSQPDGTGSIVGVAQKQVTIDDDGRGIGSITTVGTVAKVIFPADQSVVVGETQELAVAALDASDNALVLSPGAAFFLVSAGAGNLEIVSGQAHGLKPGPATVVARVDGVLSAPQTVIVRSNAVVGVNPTSSSVAIGGTQQFTSSVSNAGNQAVTWTVQEAGGGTINTSGLYTAPAKAGTYHVVATSVYDPAKTGTATVNVHVTMSVSPVTAAVTALQQNVFTAIVTGSTNSGVTWSVQEGAAGGAIDANGVYTAPSTAGTYHVVATSKADPSQSATATVTVEVGITVAPAATVLTLREQKTFAATVVGTTNLGATWTVREGPAGGTVTSAGLYTAPTTPGTYHVVATSAANPSKSATATVVVEAGSASGVIK